MKGTIQESLKLCTLYSDTDSSCISVQQYLTASITSECISKNTVSSTLSYTPLKCSSWKSENADIGSIYLKMACRFHSTLNITITQCRITPKKKRMQVETHKTSVIMLSNTEHRSTSIFGTNVVWECLVSKKKVIPFIYAKNLEMVH